MVESTAPEARKLLDTYGIAVLGTRHDGIAGITVFGDPALVERFAPPR